MKRWWYILLIISVVTALSGCYQYRICRQYNAINNDKLDRYYFVTEDDSLKKFTTRSEWLEYCSSVNPWGYSTAYYRDEPYTGAVVKFKKKGSKYYYSVGQYINGFLSGQYNIYYPNGNVYCKGYVLANDAKEQKYGSEFIKGIESWESLFLSERREYVVSEEFFDHLGQRTEYYFRDSTYLKKTESEEDDSLKVSVITETSRKVNGIEFYTKCETNKFEDTLLLFKKSDTLIVSLDRKIRSYEAYDTYIEEYFLPWEWDEPPGIIWEHRYNMEGKKHGAWYTFLQNSDTLEVRHYFHGIPVDTWIKYAVDGDTIQMRNFNNNGERHGVQKGIEKIPFYPSNSAYKFWNANYINGYINGTCLVYYDSDGVILKEKRMYSQGIMKGIYEHYWENGNIKATGNYDNGEMVGTWVYYTKDGDTLRIEKY